MKWHFRLLSARLESNEYVQFTNRTEMFDNGVVFFRQLNRTKECKLQECTGQFTLENFIHTSFVLFLFSFKCFFVVVVGFFWYTCKIVQFQYLNKNTTNNDCFFYFNVVGVSHCNCVVEETLARNTVTHSIYTQANEQMLTVATTTASIDRKELKFRLKTHIYTRGTPNSNNNYKTTHKYTILRRCRYQMCVYIWQAMMSAVSSSILCNMKYKEKKTLFSVYSLLYLAGIFTLSHNWTEWSCCCFWF